MPPVPIGRMIAPNQQFGLLPNFMEWRADVARAPVVIPHWANVEHPNAANFWDDANWEDVEPLGPPAQGLVEDEAARPSYESDWWSGLPLPPLWKNVAANAGTLGRLAWSGFVNTAKHFRPEASAYEEYQQPLSGGYSGGYTGYRTLAPRAKRTYRRRLPRYRRYPDDEERQAFYRDSHKPARYAGPATRGRRWRPSRRRRR